MNQKNRPKTEEKVEKKKPAEGSPTPSKIGREGAGSSGQNWAESPDVARKGRYAEGNRVQGDHPDHMIDTDVSEAV